MPSEEHILDRVQRFAVERPDENAFVFIRRHNDEGEPLSWHNLWSQACDLSRTLDVRGDPAKTGVLIFCNDEKHFVLSLLAVWMRGATAIPASAGLQKASLERNTHIIHQAKPDLVLHDLDEKRVGTLGSMIPEARFHAIPSLGTGQFDDMDLSGLEVGRLLQFTSGSTFSPKAVLIGADNLAAGTTTIRETYSLAETSTVLHWLPLFHDMGLIGSCISTMWNGATSIILKPSIFIQRPICWLQKIHEWRADTTSAPNFAFDRLIRQIDDDDLKGLDLSCLTTVIFGGEPVRSGTVAALVEKLAPAKFSSKAIAPSYGLAEATLLVSSGQTANGPVFSSSHSTTKTVGLGLPLLGVDLQIKQKDTGQTLQEGELGEIWISGPAVGTIVPADRDWRAAGTPVDVRTGDFGYIEDGHLFITGRDANKIIVRGKNIFAEDVEILAFQSQSEGVIEAVAAIGLEDDASENLCLFVEKSKSGSDLNIAELNRMFVTWLGVKPSQIISLRRLSLPRTSSGKIQRNEAKKMLLAGGFADRMLDHVIQAGN